MIFSVSRGKIYNNELNLVDRTDVMPDEKIKLLNSKADISLSRDIATKNYLDNLGCNNILAGCPTLFMQDIPQHYVPLINNEKTDCLISVRNPALMNIPISFQYNVKNSIDKTISLLKTKGYKNIKLICHDHRDIEFANSFQDIEYLYTDDIYTFLTYLRNTKLIVSYRLHSFLPALSFDIPVIKISYDQRAISLIDTVNMSEWNINLLKDNVLKEIEYRINNLKFLSLLKEENKKNKWSELKSVLHTNCANFAKKINQ